MADSKISDLNELTTAASADELVIVDQDIGETKKITFSNISDSLSLTADEIDDSATTNKFTSASDITKLSEIETGAEVNNISDANATDLTDGGDTTLHDHDGISENTAARHTQGTDTSLGSGAVAADHGTATNDEIINVCYGTSATPPTASTTTEGALYVQYTA